MSHGFKTGDKVQVKAEHDIPVMFRPDGKPTTGVIESLRHDTALVNVPIGDDDPSEHSQCVLYRLSELEAAE